MKGEIKMKTLFLFLASSVLASNILIYNPNDSIVSNKVTAYLRSVHTPNYNLIKNKIINPDLSNVLNVNIKYWKISNEQVVEMSITEKSNIDASVPIFKSRMQIMNDIYNSVSSPNQFKRLIKSSYYDAFQTALDDFSYDLARQLLLWAKEEGHILLEDYDLVYSKIPK